METRVTEDNNKRVITYYSCTLYVKTRRYSINSDKKREENLFVAFPWTVRKFYGLCLYFMTGEPDA